MGGGFEHTAIRLYARILDRVTPWFLSPSERLKTHALQDQFGSDLTFGLIYPLSLGSHHSCHPIQKSDAVLALEAISRAFCSISWLESSQVS